MSDLFDSIFGGGPDTPEPPDYQALATQQANLNRQFAQEATQANRPGQVTPFGSVNWTRDAKGNWTQTTTLSPEQKRLLDAQNKASQQMAQNFGFFGGKINQAFKNPITARDLPASMINAGETGQQAIMRRLAPEIARDRAALQQQLANQGLPPGSEAYNNAMSLQQQQENDLLSQAAQAGIKIGQDAQNQQFLLKNSIAMQPYNMADAAFGLYSKARGAAAPTMPSFPNFSTQAQTSGPDSLTAGTNAYNSALGQYNAQVAQANKNAENQANMALAIYSMSDVRVKADVLRIGEMPSGLPVYKFRYVWDEPGTERVGVMAQDVVEVMPDAVKMNDDGLMMVDYARL
jgi:hypothetical protein